MCICVYVSVCVCDWRTKLQYLLLPMDMAKVSGPLSVVKVSHKFEPPKSTPLLLNSDFCCFCRLLIYNCVCKYIYICIYIYIHVLQHYSNFFDIMVFSCLNGVSGFQTCGCLAKITKKSDGLKEGDFTAITRRGASWGNPRNRVE